MFGIQENDRFYIDYLIARQKDYFDSMGFNTVSANITPHKYLAELNNRIDAITKIAKSDNCIPVFITITAPSRFHPTSKRYNGETPHAISLYLSSVWAKMLRSNVFKRLKRDGGKKHYFRTYEPHKSGVPHLHALFYLPKDYLFDFKKSFIALMQREHIKQYKFLFQFRKSGYKSNWEGSTAYIVKYINKSLKSAKDGSMDDVAYWYHKHSIRRFSASNSLVPLLIFRKINYLDDFKNLYKVTLHYRNNRLDFTFYKTFIEYRFFNKEELIFDEKILWSKPVVNKSSLRTPLKLVVRKIKDFALAKVYNDKLHIGYFKNKFIPLSSEKLTVDQYSDFELFNYLQELDKRLDNFEVNLTRYGVFKEEAKRRGLILSPPCSINSYTDTFDIVDIQLE